MRDVKFKVLATSDIWVDKSTLIKAGEWLTYYPETFPIMWKDSLDLNTRRQYIGLVDKNGTEIYEGDVIEKTQYNKNVWRADKKAMQVRYVVKWNEQKHQDNDHNNKILAADPSAFNQEPGFTGHQLDWEHARKFGYHSWSAFANCEVIGNIYDKPKLASLLST